MNGMSGSSWLFKRFQSLTVIVVSAPDAGRFILNYLKKKKNACWFIVIYFF